MSDEGRDQTRGAGLESIIRDAYRAGLDAGLADQGVSGPPPETEDEVVARLSHDSSPASLTDSQE